MLLMRMLLEHSMGNMSMSQNIYRAAKVFFQPFCRQLCIWVIV